MPLVRVCPCACLPQNSYALRFDGAQKQVDIRGIYKTAEPTQVTTTRNGVSRTKVVSRLDYLGGEKNPDGTLALYQHAAELKYEEIPYYTDNQKCVHRSA